MCRVTVIRFSPLWGLLILGVIAVPGRAADLDEDGAVAPAGRWLMVGGAASRSGAALTRPLTNTVRHAWSYPAGGRIVGEPLVWDDQIVLEVVGRNDKRALHLIRRVDGKLVKTTRGYAVSHPLAPCLGRRTVVARTGAQELTVFRLERTGFDRIWTLKTDVPAGEPVFLGREIYFHNGRELRRYEFGRKQPTWSTKGTFRGRLALRGGGLYLLDYDSDGVGWLTLVDRGSGRKTERRQAAYHRGHIPDVDGATEIHVGQDQIYIHFGLEVEARGGETADGFVVARKVRDDGSVLIGLGHLASLPVAPAIRGRAALRIDHCRYRDSGELSLAWLLGGIKDDVRFLAHRYFHRPLLDVRAPPTISAGVCYLGSLAFDLERLDIHWRLPDRENSRVVPADGVLLWVEKNQTLVAYKETNAMTPRAAASDPSAGPAPEKTVQAEKAVAYMRDGTTERGTFEIQPELARGLVRVSPKFKRGSWPLADALLVLDGKGRPVYHGGRDDVIRALDRQIEDDLTRGYEDLLSRSVITRDRKLIERLMAEGWLRGASARIVRKAERKLESLEGKSPRVNLRLVEKIEAREKNLLSEALTRIEEQLARFDAERHVWARIAYLRAILDRDPKRAVAVSAVKAMLPEEIKAPAAFDALDWLDFLEAIQVTPITFIAPAPKGEKPSREQQALAEARRKWRRDVVGIQSDRLFLLTRLDRPGAIARCLSMGELVCDHLDRQFTPLGRKRGPGHRLKIYLHESQDDYIAQAGGRKDGHLQWTAGYYDFRERYSRMFVPAKAEAFKRVLGVFAHEITHQWVDERCPLFTEAERFLNPQVQPAYWIVEGLASWMEGARFDLRRRAVETVNPRSVHLDILASMVEAKMDRIPWKDVFRCSLVQFRMVPRQDNTGFVTESYWRLGALHQLSVQRLFYVQAAAATHYLIHAEKGRYRERFFRCVGQYYCGHWVLAAVERAYGLEPEELGRRIEAFACRVRKGGAP